MERTPKHIDDLLRERLYDAAPPPPAFVWDKIELELQKRRRRFFVWLFFIGLAGAGIAGLMIGNNARNGQSLTMHESALEMAKPDGNTVKSTIQEPLNKPKTAILFNKINSKNVTPIHAKLAGKGNQSIVFQENRAPLVSGNQQVNTPVSLQTTPPKNFFEGGSTTTGFSFAMLPKNQGLVSSNTQTTLPVTALLQNTGLAKLKPASAKSKAKKPVKNCYDFSKQPNAWLIDAYFGPSLAQREMVSSLDNRPYLNKRLNTEKRDMAFNAGVRASLMLKGNFLIRTGVQYDQMTEVFEYIDPDYVKYLVEITNQNGMTTIDTVGVEYGEKYQKTFNRYGMLDIPLVAGVELRKGRSGFNINAGVSLNIMFWKRGAILSPDSGEPAWFTPGTGTLEVFRPRAGMSATASIQWFYHLTPRMRVFVEPYFKKIMGPVTLSSHPVEQRYGIGGLRLGFAKILN